MSQIEEQINFIEAEYAERIATAQRETEERRDGAMVGVPFCICGIQIRVMTLHDYLTLSVQGNAHVSDAEVPVNKAEAIRFWALHDAVLMWFLSSDFSREPEKRAAFIKRVAVLNAEQVGAGVAEYIRDIFADAPRGASASSGVPVPPDPVGVSFSVYWIAALAKRFHWSRSEILALPMPELFQYLRLIRAEQRAESGKQPYAIDSEVDRLWSEKLAKVNALLATTRA